MGYDRFFEQTRKAAGELDNSTIQKGIAHVGIRHPNQSC
jgi:hypothetical protein